MKIKEIKKPVHLAWSPKFQSPLYLVAGTAAQRLNTSFDTSSAVELYNVDLCDQSTNLEIRCAFKSEYRFHKLIWSDCGNELEKGIVVGGCDAGRLLLYNAAELLKNEIIDYKKLPTKEDGLIASLDCHSGPVKALDFNSFQKYLLATGASQSEIFIWDLNKELSPMTPGAPAQPPDDVTSLSWNKQVQHIIATTFSTRCLIWDLRKNQSIITLADSTSKARWRDVKWNPQNDTQLCFASEEDQYPVVQMWDLRSLKSPIKTFEGHQKGVLSIAWCNEDPDLIISCGKDDKLLVWNPNTSSMTGEIVNEIQLDSEWNLEVNRCPRNPFLVSCSSSEGSASVLTLAGGVRVTSMNDSFSDINQHQQSELSSTQPSKYPKWTNKTTGVSFAFGGKLFNFGNQENVIYPSQTIIEMNLDEKFKTLDSILKQGDIYSYCFTKAQSSSDPGVSSAWNFIAGQFSGADFKDQMYSLLGISQLSLQEKLSHLNVIDDSKNGDNISHYVQQNSIIDSRSLEKPPSKILQNNDADGAIRDALLLGNIELAVDLCLNEGKVIDAIVLATSGSPELLAKARSKYFEKTENPLAPYISAVVNEDWYNIVDSYNLSNWKQILVALLTYTKDEEFIKLCELLGCRLSTEGDGELKKAALICYICAGNVNELIKSWKTNRTGSVDEIQELAELGLLMKEAVKARTGLEIPITGIMADVLLQYALLLASQEYLEETNSHLGNSREENIETFEDRLMYALGLKTDRMEIPKTQPTGFLNSQRSHQVSYPEHYGVANNLQADYNSPTKSVVKPDNELNQPKPVPVSSSEPAVLVPTEQDDSVLPSSASVKAYGSDQPSYQHSNNVTASNQSSTSVFDSKSINGLSDTQASAQVTLSQSAPAIFTPSLSLSTSQPPVVSASSTPPPVPSTPQLPTVPVPFTPSVAPLSTNKPPSTLASPTPSPVPSSNPQLPAVPVLFTSSSVLSTPPPVPFSTSQPPTAPVLFTPSVAPSSAPLPHIALASSTPPPVPFSTSRPPSAPTQFSPSIAPFSQTSIEPPSVSFGSSRPFFAPTSFTPSVAPVSTPTSFIPSMVPSSLPQPSTAPTLFTPSEASLSTPTSFKPSTMQPFMPQPTTTPSSVPASTTQLPVAPAQFTSSGVPSFNPQLPPVSGLFTPTMAPTSKSQPSIAPTLFMPSAPPLSTPQHPIASALFTSSTPTASIPQTLTFNPPTTSQFPQFNGTVGTSPTSAATARGTSTPPPPPPSSQVPYNSARRTPDQQLQGKSKYLIDPSLQGGATQRNISPNNFSPLPGAMIQSPVSSVVPPQVQNRSSFSSVLHQTSNSYSPDLPAQWPQQSVSPEIPADWPQQQAPPKIPTQWPQQQAPPKIPTEWPQQQAPPKIPTEWPQQSAPPKIPTVGLQQQGPPKIPTEWPQQSAPPKIPTVGPQQQAPPKIPTQWPQQQAPPKIPTEWPQQQAPPKIPTEWPQQSAPPKIPTVGPQLQEPPKIPTEWSQQSAPPKIPTLSPQQQAPPKIPTEWPQQQAPSKIPTEWPQQQAPPKMPTEWPQQQAPPKIPTEWPQQSAPPKIPTEWPQQQASPKMPTEWPQQQAPPKIPTAGPQQQAPPKISTEWLQQSAPPKIPTEWPQQSAPPKIPTEWPQQSAPPKTPSEWPQQPVVPGIPKIPLSTPASQFGWNGVSSNAQTQSHGDMPPKSYSGGVVSSRQTIQETPTPKPPLPEQHSNLQKVFDELHDLCYKATGNPQMKRKLADVIRKLEMLYDAIRGSKLSPTTLKGLHEIASAIQNGNYQECLSIHTKLVSGPEFSIIACFMPGIKILVQSAMQLGVYLQ